MLQTNYTLPIDFDIKCENETLKKVVGAATVHNAETTGELWNYLQIQIRSIAAKSILMANAYLAPLL